MIVHKKQHADFSPAVSGVMALVDRYAFLQDTLSLFKKERHGHMGLWHYSDALGQGDTVHGSDLWGKFISGSKNYYLLSSEKEVLETKLGYLLRPSVQKISLIDFGPGSVDAIRAKTFPVIRGLGNVKNYCPVDCSNTFLEDACRTVSSCFPFIKTVPYCGNYVNEDIDISVGSENCFGIFMGSSISNIESNIEDSSYGDRVINLLKTFRHILGNNSQMVFSYDSNQDEKSIYESYMHPAQIEFGCNVMQRIYRDLPVSRGYNPLAWEYRPMWYAKTHQLCHTVTAQEDMRFTLGSEDFYVRCGDVYILDNSFKYTREEMEEYLVDAGWISQGFVSDTQGRVIVQHMSTV